MPRPLPMPFQGKDIPHLVIEVNQACNMSCTACYKARRAYTKPTPLIKEEIDLAAGQRNLDMITLAGGEPSLHPDFVEIIRYIDGKGIKVSMLTNGLGLTDEVLRSYRRAGLSRVMVHIDSLQKRPDAPGATCEKDLNPLRERIMRRIGEHGMRGGLTVTAYQRNMEGLADVIDFALSNRWVSLVLVACCKSFSPIAERYGREGSEPLLEDRVLQDEEVPSVEVMEMMERAFDLAPTHYIASNLSDAEMRWLFYLAFTVTGNGDGYRTMYLSSRFRRMIEAANQLQKIFKSRYKFDMVPSRSEAIIVCLAYAVLGMDLGNFRDTMRFLSGLLKPGAEIHSKVLVVQQPPNLTESGAIEHCKDCPDATVRNGRIMPLCLADIVSPL